MARGRGRCTKTLSPSKLENRLFKGGLGLVSYQREIEAPKSWAGRHITVYAEYVNSLAAVYVDGKRMGQIYYPAGEVDVTPACRPGGKHLLSMRVVAMPLDSVVLAYGDTNEGKLVKGGVSRRGLTGDVFLMSTPTGAHIDDVKIDRSVRRWQITFGTALKLNLGAAYRLRALILDNGQAVKQLVSEPFTTLELREGRYAFTNNWKPEKLWDLHTPRNMYTLELSLLDLHGKLQDTYRPVQFGFREFDIRGRDFYLLSSWHAEPAGGGLAARAGSRRLHQHGGRDRSLEPGDRSWRAALLI